MKHLANIPHDTNHKVITLLLFLLLFVSLEKVNPWSPSRAMDIKLDLESSMAKEFQALFSRVESVARLEERPSSNLFESPQSHLP